ncbi:MAG: radical SAM protein [bacterium]|nr:radical SAM protein [bacterium]
MFENERLEKKDILSCTKALTRCFEPEPPLAKLFRTHSSGFLYDPGTNLVLQLREEVFELMDLLLNQNTEKAVGAFIRQKGESQFIEAAGEIIEAIREENLLQVNPTTRFSLAGHCQDLESDLSSSMGGINLDVTQECNLRCGYCIYNHHVKDSREFSTGHMSDDVARKAIDFLERHSRQSESAAVGYYGGEPLMRVPFIKMCVEYAKQRFGDRKLEFPITTNATLVTPEIAEYLLSEGFSVLVSIDGPMPRHNRFRKKRDGGGSFEDTLRGLRILVEKHREIKKGSIAVSVVYTPPFSAKQLDEINDFFKGLDWLRDVYIRISYPSENTVPVHLVPENGLHQDKDMNEWAFEKYKSGYENSDMMVKGIIEKEFTRLMQRTIFTKPEYGYSLNACCIPGRKKCYITTDGRILICEKITCHAPAIGHVETGFDFETIKRVYVDEYLKAGIGDCSGCWALRLCEICYIMAFNVGGELDMEKKRKQCAFCRDSQERVLTEFMSLLESAPEKLDYLYRQELE